MCVCVGLLLKMPAKRTHYNNDDINSNNDIFESITQEIAAVFGGWAWRQWRGHGNFEPTRPWHCGSGSSSIRTPIPPERIISHSYYVIVSTIEYKRRYYYISSNTAILCGRYTADEIQFNESNGAPIVRLIMVIYNNRSVIKFLSHFVCIFSCENRFRFTWPFHKPAR